MDNKSIMLTIPLTLSQIEIKILYHAKDVARILKYHLCSPLF